ncbi:hypothetical protein F4801DRAFT_581651 [Xylaria longipes]|nr:hypothetical protein F4801DRAFT_581651 [Xylaria longipes]
MLSTLNLYLVALCKVSGILNLDLRSGSKAELNIGRFAQLALQSSAFERYLSVSKVRLINVHTKSLEDFIDDTKPTPPYAILSHTWGPDHEEISFQDLQADEMKTGPGREKFEACCAHAILDDLSYAWMDTCCIDKTNSTELSEGELRTRYFRGSYRQDLRSINSMFKWYKNARLCYAYLCDVDSTKDAFESQSTFWKSRWFRRGWTLQELIAPEILRFYDGNWRAIGHKRDPQVVAALVQITHIPRVFLLGIVPTNEASVAQRMSWAANRVTKRTEDLAYSLLGIFGITMPMVYGEGDKSFLRLQEVIARHINDDSILAWNFSKDGLNTKLSGVKSGGALANSPSSFAYSSHIVPSNPSSHVGGPLDTLGGSLHLRRHVHTDSSGQRFVILQCQLDDQPTAAIGVPVQVRSGGYDKYIRHPEQPVILIQKDTFFAPIEEVLIPVDLSHSNDEVKRRNAFCIENAVEKDLELVSVAPHSCWDKTNSILVPNDEARLGSFQRLWTMFKPRDASANFILILDLFWKGSTPQVQHYIITCNTGIELEAVRQDLHKVDEEVFLKQEKSAGNGTLNIETKVTRERVGAHDMFVVRLLPSEKIAETYNCTKNLERVQLERKMVDTFQQYHQSEEAFKSANVAVEKKQAKLEPITKRLAEVRAGIDMLLREQSRLQQMEEKISLDIAKLGTKSDKLKGMRDTLLGNAEALHRRFQEESPETDVLEPTPQDWTEKAADEMIKAKEATGYFQKGAKGLWDSYKRVTDPTQKFLFAAAIVAYQPPFRQLARWNVDVNVVSPNCASLIAFAARYGSKPIVRNLLALGADTNPKDGNVSPLFAACSGGHVDVVNLLLCHDSGATKDLKVDSCFPLASAARWGHTAVVELLLKFGADIEASQPGGSALIWAARGGHAAVVELLLKFGADIEASHFGGSALIWAANNGHEAVVRLLLDLKGNHKITDAVDGYTARYHAKRSGHFRIVGILDELSTEAETETRDRSSVLSKIRNRLGMKREASDEVARSKASSLSSRSTG